MNFNIWGSPTRRRTVTPGDKNYLLRLSHGTCEYCSKNIIGRGIQAEVHHIVPHASGGSDNYHNLIVLCPDCHSRADHISKESFRLKIAYRLTKKTLEKLNIDSTKIKKPYSKKSPKTKTKSKKTTIKKRPVKKTAIKKTAVRKSPVKNTKTKKTAAKRAPTKRTKTKRK